TSSAEDNAVLQASTHSINPQITTEKLGIDKNIQPAAGKPTFLKWGNYDPSEEEIQRWIVEYYEAVKPWIGLYLGWLNMTNQLTKDMIKWTFKGYILNLGNLNVYIAIPSSDEKNPENTKLEYEYSKIISCISKIRVNGVLNICGIDKIMEPKTSIDIAFIYSIIYKTRECKSIVFGIIPNIESKDIYKNHPNIAVPEGQPLFDETWTSISAEFYDTISYAALCVLLDAIFIPVRERIKELKFSYKDDGWFTGESVRSYWNTKSGWEIFDDEYVFDGDMLTVSPRKVENNESTGEPPTKKEIERK
ncbi:hypothetical protein NEAUS07_2417, partial [Nematocida ausubeli]